MTVQILWCFFIFYLQVTLILIYTICDASGEIQSRLRYTSNESKHAIHIFFFLSNVNWLPGIGDVRSGHDQLKVISLESIDQLKQALKRDQAFGSKPLLRTINDQNQSSIELERYNRQP